MFGAAQPVTAVETQWGLRASQPLSEVLFYLITAGAPVGTVGFIYTILSTLGDVKKFP